MEILTAEQLNESIKETMKSIAVLRRSIRHLKAQEQGLLDRLDYLDKQCVNQTKMTFDDEEKNDGGSDGETLS